VTLHGGEREALQKRSTSITSLHALSEGALPRRTTAPDTLRTGLQFFREALSRDQGFAKAHAGVATVYSMLGQFQLRAATEAWPEAKAAVARALGLMNT